MSTQERLFRNLISKLICKKAPVSEEREKRLLTFYNHAELYYDNFCESIYTLMATNSIDSISLDEFGNTRLDADKNDSVIGYGLLFKEDITYPNDDVIVYVELALKRLESRLNRIEEQSNPQRQSRYREIKIL